VEQEKEDKSSEPRVALSALAIKKMKAGDADKSDIGEYIGLRVTCSKAGAKSFVYRYRSPIDNPLKRSPLAHFLLCLLQKHGYPWYSRLQRG
jgi:hypothetical protein